MSHVLVGDDTGLIKRVKLRDSSVTKFGSQSAARSVSRLAWAGTGDAWESREKECMVGLRSGVVELWNNASKEVVGMFDALSITSTQAQAAPIDASTRAPTSVNAGSRLVGMDVLQPRGAFHERRLLTCSDLGIVHTRPFSTLAAGLNATTGGEDMTDEPMPAAKSKSSKHNGHAAASSAGAAAAAAGCSSFSVGGNICVLRVEPVSQSKFLTGGKEHMLKLWDLDSATVEWKEKNVAHDMLNLRQQVWITCAQFVPGSEASQFVTGTAWHQVRRYDTRVQKRAIYSTEVGDHAVTCLSLSLDGRYMVVGDGGGRLQQLDTRMNARMVHVYHGIGGSVRSVEAHPTLPIITACGLDRFLRVYDVHTRKQLHKVYLKQKLNAALFSSQTPEADRAAEEEAELLAAEALPPLENEGEGETDELWSELNQRARRQAQAQTEGTGTGQYVKKRKADDAEDAEAEGAKKKSKKTKVKLEDEPSAAEPAPRAAASASSSFKPSPFTKVAAKPATPAARGMQIAAAKGGQIVFRQTVAFDEGESDEDGEDDGAGDDDGEDDAGEDAGEEADENAGDDGDVAMGGGDNDNDEDGGEQDAAEQKNEEEEAAADEEDDVMPEEPVPAPVKRGRPSRKSAPAASTAAAPSTATSDSTASPARGHHRQWTHTDLSTGAREARLHRRDDPVEAAMAELVASTPQRVTRSRAAASAKK